MIKTAVQDNNFNCYSFNLSIQFKLNLSFFLLMPLSSLLPFNASAGLQATTANTIQGTAPYLLLKDGETELMSLDELLGFSMPKQDGSEGREQIDINMIDSVLTAPPGMRFQDISALVTADGQLHDLDLLVDDDDGDASQLSNTNVTGQMRVTWYKDGVALRESDLKRFLSTCEDKSYTLTLEIPTVVSANTTYGDPRRNDYGTHSQVTYTFMSAAQGICYLQPDSMDVNTGTEGVTIKYAKGYNPVSWEPGKGFKASSGFPTTGFNKAKFNVIGYDDDQRNYRCRVDSGNWVELSGSASSSLGQNCTVTYNTVTKPTKPVTIKMDYTVDGGNTWKEISNYTISIPTKWATLKVNENYTTAASFKGDYVAAQLCGAPLMTGLSESNINTSSSYFFSKNELTNAPQSSGGYYTYNNNTWKKIGTLQSGGFFSRDVDSTFMGEWGKLSSPNDKKNSHYPNSGFDLRSEWIWGAEAYSSTQQYCMSGENGRVDKCYVSINKYLVMCR